MCRAGWSHPGNRHPASRAANAWRWGPVKTRTLAAQLDGNSGRVEHYAPHVGIAGDATTGLGPVIQTGALAVTDSSCAGRPSRRPTLPRATWT